jgi:hypothetical protein
MQGVLQFGMVVENAEFVSSDESSGDEEEEQVKMGTVRVAWYPAGTEEVGQDGYSQSGLVSSWYRGGRSRWVQSEWPGTQLVQRR